MAGRDFGAELFGDSAPQVPAESGLNLADELFGSVQAGAVNKDLALDLFGEAKAPTPRAPSVPGPTPGLVGLINKQPAPRQEERQPGFMLRPEFVEEVRSSFADLPPEKRRAALELAAAGSGVRAQAAQRILADVRAEDERSRAVNVGREKLVDLVAKAKQKPVFGSGPAGRVQFPDVSPTFLEQMEQVPEKERIEKRLAREEAARVVTAAATSPEAIRDREERDRGFFDQVYRSFVDVGVPQAQAGGMAMNLVAQNAQMEKIANKISELEQQGRGDSEEAVGLRKTLDFYTQRQQTYMQDLAKKQQELSVAPTYRGVRQLSEAKTFKEGFDVFANDPSAIVVNLAAQSLPTMVPALVLGVINPALGTAAMGGSSLGVEFGGSLMEFAQENGFDTRDPEQMAAFFADKKMLREGINKAGKRAGIVAAGDMFLSGLASKTMVPKRITGPVAKNVANMVTQMGAQAIGGGGFEAAAQLATEGAVTKPGEVLAELFGEFAGAPAEVYAQTRQAARDLDRQRATERLQEFRDRQPAPPSLSDEDRQILVDYAQQRLAELTRKANGTEEQIITTPDGKQVRIPAEPKQFMDRDDRDELQFLLKHADNPDMLSRLYEITKPEPEPEAKAPPSTEALEGRLKELEQLAGITEKKFGVREPIIQNANIGPAHEDYKTEVTDTALRAIQEGNFTPVTLKDGTEIDLVVSRNADDTEGRVLAFNKKGEEVGQVAFVKVEDESGARFNPNVYVEEGLRRKGLATAMYDLAEQSGAKIPSIEQPGQLRTEEGDAFRAARTMAQVDRVLPPSIAAEEMEGMPAPREPEIEAEVERLTRDQEQALAAREKLVKRTEGTSLIKVLKGTLNDGELSELGGRARQVGKNPFLNLKASKGKVGSSMEDRVDSGDLDLFLPEDKRPGHPDYVNSESAEYIREKLRNGEYYTYETEAAIEIMDRDIEGLERQIQELLSEDEINKEIQYAVNEQRELDQALAEPAAEEEAGAAAERAGEEEGFLKAQTEQELRDQEAKREAAEKKEAETKREEERKAAAPKAEEFVLTGSERAADEAEARGQQTFLSISPSVLRASEKRTPSITRRAKVLRRQFREGKISEAEYVMNLNSTIDAAERAEMEKELPKRVRGADYLRQRILEAKRNGVISEKAADLAEWFILKNPSLVDDLGISLKTPGDGEEGVAGRYLDMPRIILLMKDAAKDDTIVHEILHHLERMMPPDVRAAIRKEWGKQLANAKKNAKTENEKKFFELLFNFHYGDGTQKDFATAIGMIKNGLVSYDNYQYVNPSEFWAVNGSEIVTGRYDAIRGGKLQRLKNWLKELAQKLKSVFGLESSAPIIRALDSLAKADGKFVTNKMLAEEAPEFASIKGEQEEPQPSTKKSVEDTWLLGRDEMGNVGFGPGAKAYKIVANITNQVLDKVALKPISPELGRAMRNMKARVDLVQNKIAEVATEMSKLSPAEREMISDIIEGELKAGIHPPQHVLNLAAAIQSMMSRQSQELVDLGMLSKEAANRWDNKYLPRFYENKLRDEVNAWAKAAKAVFMKQPLMRGIRGAGLRSRGMFETINAADLQDWIDQGWEQRDPDFNPKTSTETVVWRDYTRQEREDMGEIRDAMFRFVMGYNASQRDIALGRLYRDLAKNYASKGPVEGYVQVPKGNVEGTGAPRYGDLEGMYVPKEIMDHLSANDHAMASGVLKIYRAALSKWKEGKTVLNPVSHANNVISNVTMAHFAGVSYWDAHKYAGAVKDLATNDEMVKEAEEVGLFGGTFNQEEIMRSMPPQLRAMANMTESKLANFGERIWDILAYTVEVGGKKYGVRPVMQWAYENEDTFFRYVIYRDARNRGMDPEDARDYSQQFIFTYDDLPKGARMLRDFAIPFFSYGYKVVPVLARTALVYPWRYAAPATVAYTANAMMYAIAASLGGDEDDWWGKVLYKYVTDEEFRNKARALEEEERRHLPEWLKGHSGILSTPKAIRMGIDEVTGLPMFLDISRIFPGGDLLDANNNAGGVAFFQPLMPTNPVINTLVAMLANKDMFLGKDVTVKTDTEAEKSQKRAAWLWKQMSPAISVGNYHFDRGMNTIAQMTGKPITIDAGPLGVASYTGIGKDGLPIQPKHAMLQTMGIKIRPYDLEISKGFEESAKRQLIREIDFAISRINRQEGKGVISAEAAKLERDKLLEKKQNVGKGLTLEGKEKK